MTSIHDVLVQTAHFYQLCPRKLYTATTNWRDSGI